MGGRFGDDTFLVGIVVVEFWYSTRSTSIGAGKGELDDAPSGGEELGMRIVSCGFSSSRGSLVLKDEAGTCARCAANCVSFARGEPNSSPESISSG